MALTSDDIGRIAHLARLELSPEEAGRMLTRVNGFFDEPGAFAFWGMFALLFNKLMFDNKKLEIIIMVSLLFTFSAAYFVLLPIYFFA